jgi:hypothetical protein
MTPGEKRRLKADACRARASEAVALAQASLLENVRQKHERAAVRWRELAELALTVTSAPRLPAPPARERANQVSLGLAFEPADTPQ